MPSLLGVSKAVLENVIFCHQEDSNWPLSEPAPLKKKFDDIFEATRWTKALENIKALRKARTIELKVEVATLEGLRQDKLRADAIVEKKSQLTNDLAKKNEELKNLQDEIEVACMNVKVTYDAAMNYKETLRGARALEEKEALHLENVEALKMTMTESTGELIEPSLSAVSSKSSKSVLLILLPLFRFVETDEELMRSKESFRSRLDTNRNRLEQFSRKVSNKKDENRVLENKCNRALTDKGSLEAEKKNHANVLVERERQIRKISAELGIKGYDIEVLSDEQIKEFTTRLEDEMAKQQNALTKMKVSSGSKGS